MNPDTNTHTTEQSPVTPAGNGQEASSVSPAPVVSQQPPVAQTTPVIQEGVPDTQEVTIPQQPATQTLQPEANTATPAKSTFERLTGPDFNKFLDRVFIGGFASIFLVNGVVAWQRPADFIKLLHTFPAADSIGHIGLMVTFVAIHDTILGILILSGKWRKYVLAWAGVWLALVTTIKAVSLI